MDGRPVRAGFWVVLLVGVFAWAPATYPGYWRSLEGFVPVFDAVDYAPIARVATAPDLWRGAGSGAFLLAQPFLLAGLDAIAAVRATFILALLLGGLGIYSWLAPSLGDRAAGLGGLLYMLLPPVLATVYVRGSVGDALVLGLLPLALAGLSVYAAGRSPVAAGVAVLCILWMWRTQAGLAGFATLMLLLYVALVVRSRLGALAVAVSGVAGLASLLPSRRMAGPPPVDFFDHFVTVEQLLGGVWQVAPSVPGWQDGYPFFVGLVALAFSAAGLWLWLADPHAALPPATARLLTFAFAGAGILLVAGLGASAWLWQLTGAHRLLAYPWQITLLAAPLLAVTAGSLATHGRALAAMPYWAVLIALTVLSSSPYLAARFTQVQPPPRPLAVIGSQNDLLLLDAQLTEDAAAAQAQLDVTWQVLRPPPFDYNVFFQALTEDAQGGLQTVAQLDVQPRDGLRPATTWQAGEILTDTYRLDLAAVAPAIDVGGPTLTYYFGYYDWRDGARLPVDGGRDDKVVFHGR